MSCWGDGIPPIQATVSISTLNFQKRKVAGDKNWATPIPPYVSSKNRTFVLIPRILYFYDKICPFMPTFGPFMETAEGYMTRHAWFCIILVNYRVLFSALHYVRWPKVSNNKTQTWWINYADNSDLQAVKIQKIHKFGRFVGGQFNWMHVTGKTWKSMLWGNSLMFYFSLLNLSWFLQDQKHSDFE